MHNRQETHAIVIGGGIAGLLTTRVLLKHFDQVTLIERDHYPQEPVFRPGVPQGRQGHTLLLQGQHIIEALFPGIQEKLIAHGAIDHNYGSGTLYYYGERCPRLAPTIWGQGWNSTRLLLEWQIHQELMIYDHLHIMEGFEVVHLLFDQSKETVCGVQFRERNHNKPEDNILQELKADLVVDASGSTSHAPEWLKDLGYETPQETEINTHLGYATRLYEPPGTHQEDWWKFIAIQSTQSKRGGVLMDVEGGKWLVILAGSQKDYPPTQDTEYLEFAHSLPDQVLYESIKNARPISPIYGYRRTANRMRHFERLKRQPENFIVIGDGVCSFNPIYGQGMTVAALEAQALDTSLPSWQRKRKGFAHQFQRKIARLLVSPWLLATVADVPASEKQGVIAKLSQWYLDRLIMLLPRDPYALRAFLKVLHMVKTPLALAHPRIIAKILLQKG
ncbi:hypothetical protein KDK_70630 [Dictyobacter kobayashii]|uniref:FAD-binding domain-containing protein n=2 Tax=Dictyobacter kobayashii TaxID=2014872 RepID=A0A402AW62_9CHLR|nr:hypothetical protein KDK_70630 [Dictyobacter kobayashii]